MILPEYRIFESPYGLSFREMSRKQVQAYFEWFLGHIPVRLNELRRAVASSGGNEISLDFSERSVVLLGKWFNCVVETRSLDTKELEAEKRNLPQWVHDYLDDWQLTAQTISLCVDLGIYFGEALRHRHDRAQWDIVWKPKIDADLHQPVLVPANKRTHVNPTRIMLVIAYKVMDGQSAEEEMPRVFAVWDDVFSK